MEKDEMSNLGFHEEDLGKSNKSSKPQQQPGLPPQERNRMV
jgi:hypothetical protein